MVLGTNPFRIRQRPFGEEPKKLQPEVKKPLVVDEAEIDWSKVNWKQFANEWYDREQRRIFEEYKDIADYRTRGWQERRTQDPKRVEKWQSERKNAWEAYQTFEPLRFMQSPFAKGLSAFEAALTTGGAILTQPFRERAVGGIPPTTFFPGGAEYEAYRRWRERPPIEIAPGIYSPLSPKMVSDISELGFLIGGHMFLSKLFGVLAKPIKAKVSDMWWKSEWKDTPFYKDNPQWIGTNYEEEMFNAFKAYRQGQTSQSENIIRTAFDRVSAGEYIPRPVAGGLPVPINEGVWNALTVAERTALAQSRGLATQIASKAWKDLAATEIAKLAEAPLTSALINEGEALVTKAEAIEAKNPSVLEFKRLVTEAKEATSSEVQRQALVKMEALEDEVRTITQVPTPEPVMPEAVIPTKPPKVKPPIVEKPVIETPVARRTEIQSLLAEPAKNLQKGVTKIELRKELGEINKTLVPQEKKLRQQIMVAVKTKGLPQSQYRKIFLDKGGSRQLTLVKTPELESVLEAVKVARPVKVRGKTVLKAQTERDIQSLKDILTAEQRLTPEIYESIKNYLKLPTDKFESIEKFITESEARNLIRQMNYEAESGLAEWDSKVVNALVDKPDMKIAIDKISSSIEKANLPVPKQKMSVNWRKFAFEISEVPNDVGLSGTMSILRALRRFQEQLGGRSATRIYDVAEMMIETRRLNELRLTQRIGEMKAEVPSLTRITQDEKSMQLIQQWLDSDLAIAKVEKPTLTDTELEVAKLFRREYDSWKDTVRIERFKDAYYHYKGNAELIKSGTERTGEVAILDAPLADIKQAIGIYESQGETALNEFLKTKDWGVLESGYSFSQVVHPQLKMGKRISVRATTTSLHQRKGLDFLKDERTSWERLVAYERQMIGLNLQPYFRKMDREFRNIVDRLADPSSDSNKISIFLQEVKGFPVESPVIRLLLRVGGWSFGTLSKVPWMSIRNLHQNIAFHPDKAEVLKSLATGGFYGNPATRNGRLDYTKSLVYQHKGVLQEQLLMGYVGKTPLENLIRSSDYYHYSDKLNRFASMAGSGAKADRALKAFLKDGDTGKFLRNSGANELSQTEQLRILEYLAMPNYEYGGVLDTVSGGEASIRDISNRITTLTHFNYVRYLRSAVEMGEMGRVIGSLVAFPRSIVERYADFFSRLRPSRNLTGAGRRRAFHSLLAMVIGSVVASAMLNTITGKKRDAYNPLLVLQWQVGGLAVGATQEVMELYRLLSNLAFAKEESDKDYALKELAILIPRLGDMFIPFYAPTMNAIEALKNERYIDRKAFRQLRSMFDKSYELNEEFYEIERNILEAWQHGLFGTNTPDPSDLEQSLSRIKGLKDDLGKVDEEAFEKARQTAQEKGWAFEREPEDFIYTMSNLGSDFNSAIYGLDPSVITIESGFSPLLLDYLEYQAMFDEYKAEPQDDRYEFREENPIIDANLFFWGYVTTLQSDTSRNLVRQMMDKYRIPKEAIRGYESEFGETEQVPEAPTTPARQGLGENPFK